MNKFKTLRLTGGSVVAAFVIIGCDSTNMTGGSGKKEERRVNAPAAEVKGDQQGASADNSAADDNTQNGGAQKNPSNSKTVLKPTTPSGPPPAATNAETAKDAAKAASDIDFGGLCAKAQEVKPVASGRLKPLLVEFCDGSTPTALLTTTLIASAYVGTGEPQPTAVQALKSDAATKTTSYRLAIAIKIPITVKDHFDKVGPLAGNTAEIKKLQESTGGKATVTLLNTHPADGTYHVQGWTTNSKVVKDVPAPIIGSIAITSDADTRNDNFKFVEGEQIFYTQYTSKSVQTLKYFDFVAAGVKVESSHYLLAVVDIALDNKGIASAAETEIKKLAAAGIKQMYNQAAQVK